MLLRGFSDAIMMRSQQALAFQSPGYLPPEHYDQIFSAHGTLMIFFVAMPFVIGLMNFVVPLQLGVRDVAFPTLNSVGFWLTATGALLVNISLVVGELARIMRDLAVETSCRHLPSGTSRPIATGSRSPLASTP
jgi:cytochrome o ubiquinol oxidase subunit 1